MKPLITFGSSGVTGIKSAVGGLMCEVFAEECLAFPDVISAISRGEVSIDRGRVRGSVTSRC